MDEQKALWILGIVGALITDSHIVYTSGKHGTAYVNKDAVYPHPTETSRLCRGIAERFASDNVEVVIAPAIGGVPLSQWTAHHLTEITGRQVFAVYAERAERSLIKGVRMRVVSVSGVAGFDEVIAEDEELVTKGSHFLIKRGYDKFIAGRRVLVVEDVLTTGGSARKVVEAVRAIGGNVIGLGVLVNRGGVRPQDVGGVPKFTALVNVRLDAWDEEKCPLCQSDVPVNTDIGKGREFLAQRRA